MKKSLRLSLLLLTVFTLMLTAVKAQSPVFSTTPTTKVYVGQPYSYTFSASDTNNNPISYTTPTLPSWLTLGGGTPTLSTLAGLNNSPGTFDGQGSAARFNGSWNMATDADGNIYVADYQNHRIRKITPTGLVSTLAGSTPGDAVGASNTAQFAYPIGVAVDASGDVYVSDLGNLKIKKIATDGTVTTIASSFYAYGLGFGPDGNLYTSYEGEVRRINPNDGTSTIISLSGQTSFRGFDLAINSSGELFVTDYGSGRILKVVVSGNSGVSTLFANTVSPLGLDIDNAGNLYTASYTNGIVFKITQLGVVSTVLAGTGQSTYGVAVNKLGTVIYLARFSNYIIDKLDISSRLQGTPALANIGRHPVKITANNGTTTTDQDFNIDVYGPQGNALAFNGSNYVELTGRPVNLNSGNQFTIETWFKTTATNTVLFSYTDGNSSWNPGEKVFDIIAGRLHFDGFNIGGINGLTTANDGKWHHVAITSNGTSAGTRLFLDGIDDTNTATSGYGGGAGDIGVARIGFDPFGGGNSFNGTLDQFRIWNVNRTPAQILDGMTKITPTVVTGLVANYDFDQGVPAGDNTAITTLLDKTNTYNGTLTGFVKTNGNTTSNFVNSYAVVIPTAIAANTSNSGFTANWTAPTVGTALSYQIDYSISATFANAVTSTTSATTAVAITNLKPSTTYYYRVRAVSGTEIGANSNTILATTTALTPPGNALALDGGDDRVIVDAAGSAATNFAPTDAFTIETWVKPNSFAGNPAIFTHKQTGINSDGYGFFFESTGRLYLETKNSGVASDLRATAGKWNHVAVTYNANIARFYLNGQLAGTSTVQPTTLATSNITAVIGSFDNPNYFMNGSFDELKVYKKELSQTEIQTDMYQVGTLPASNLVLYYNFDQGVANGNNTGVVTLYDQSPNGYNGTLTSMTLNGTNSNWVPSYAVIAPNALAATNISASGFTANWAAPASGTVSSYELDYSPSATFASTTTTQTGLVGTSFVVTNLKPGTAYYYRIRAVSGANIGGVSKSVTVNTTTLTPPGNALAFNGSNNYVAVNTTLGNFGTADFTLEAWAKTSPGVTNIILSKRNAPSNGSFFQLTVPANNKAAFELDGGSYNTIAGSSTLNDNKWHHLAVVRNGMQLFLYVDGELDAAPLTMTASPNPNSSAEFQIGHINVGGNNNYIAGTVDEVRVYNTALTQANIQADLKNTSSSVPANLLAYFNFDHGLANGTNTGVNTLYDQTTNGNNGTLSNNFALTGTTSNWVGSYAMVVPTATAPTNINPSGFTANWTAPATGTVTSYQIDYTTSPTFANAVSSTTSPTTSLAITNLKPSTAYYYRVRAVSGTEIGGNSNPASVTTVTLTPPGNALALDGTNDLISVNGVASNTFNLGTDFTLEAWIKCNTLGTTKVVVGNIGSGDYWLGMENEKARFSISGSGVSSGDVVTDGKWHHIAGSRSGSTISIYVDGVLQGTSSNNGNANPNSVLTIGSFSNDYFFPGSIDNVRVWTRTLTGTEIAQGRFSDVKTGTNLLASYNFDQGFAGGNNAGITTLYESVSGLNATLSSFALTGNTSNWVGSYAMVVPTAITATTVLNTSMVANWIAPASVSATVSTYQLQYSTSAVFATSTTINNIAGNLTSYELTNLSPNTNYYYRVSAVSGTTELGGYSNAVAATTTAYLPTGNALAFDQTLGNQAPVNSTNFPSGNSSYTIEAWVNPRDLASGADLGIIGWGDYNNQNKVNALRFGGGPGNYIIHNYWWANDLSASIPDVSGKWTHIAATFDQTTGRRTIYIDGRLAASDVPDLTLNGGHNVTSTNITIGKTVGTEYFNGSLDEVRVYNTARTQAQIQADLQTATAATAGLIAAYNFEQGIANGNNTTITSVVDNSDNVNKGTLINFTKTGSTSNFVGTNNYPMEPAVATTASSVTINSFVANWSAPVSISATTYELDVATDASFVNLLSAYSSTITGNVDNFEVTGLTPGSTYYYRVRANSEFFGTAANSNSITVTGDKADQTITLAATNSVTYGVADYALGATSTNSGIALVYSSSNPSIATVSSTGTVQVLMAGSVTITATQAGDAQHNAAATQTQNLLIEKKALTLNAVVLDKVYDGTATATATLAVTGTVHNDSIIATAATATFNNKTVGTNKAVTVEGITITGANVASYSYAASITTAASITARSLVVSASATDKIYDGAANATVTISDDRISGDAVSITYATANFNNKNVAMGKTVTVTGISISGTDALNYMVNATVTTAASITARSLVVSATAADKVYDGSPSATVTISDNRVAGDAVTVTYTASTFNDQNVATGKTVTVNGISISGTDAANYTVTTTATTSASITARNLVVSATATNKVYDGNVIATVGLSDNRVAGNAVAVTYTTATFNDKTVASGKTVTVSGISISGTDAANYVVNTTAVTSASITVRSLTVSATATDKTYDGSATATVALTDNRVSGDQLTIAYANASFNNANVGTAKAVTINGITVRGLDVNNYMFNTAAATAASITPKALTITADNKSRLQGVANPTLTVSYNGFIAGQNNTNALSTQANITTTATVASTPGAYPITASGAVATNGNYAIAYVGGTLTVNASAVTGISLAAATLYENRPAGTTAGTLSSTSTDPAATFTYTLVAGTGNADNARFTIAGNQIVTAGPLDFEAQSSYAIRVRSTTQFGVFAEQTFIINILDVNEAPTLNAVADQTVCYTTAVQNIALAGITAGPEAGQTVSMTITTNNPGLFRSLSVTKGNGTAGTFSYGISNGWSGTAIVTISVKDDGGTANSGNDTFTRTFNITVNPLPVVSIVSSVPSNSVSRGETLQLMANALGAASYSWSNANGIISEQNSANLTIKPTQTTTYTVTAFNSTGCSESKQITIEVRNDFFAVKANNILTPNGDGANDTWIITNIDQYPNAEVKVFDRAGRVVFQRKGYDNSWNGSFNGTPLNEGAYMYVIDFGSGLFKAKGTVTILHNN